MLHVVDAVAHMATAQVETDRAEYTIHALVLLVVLTQLHHIRLETRGITELVLVMDALMHAVVVAIG
jgi:hypothetical protein